MRATYYLQSIITACSLLQNYNDEDLDNFSAELKEVDEILSNVTDAIQERG